MNKALSLVLTTLLFLTLTTTVLAQTATEPAVGDGSSGDPYQIASLENLYWISQNSGEWDKHYIQTANIDASATSGWGGGGWTPIGNTTTYFRGIYDGGGHIISGLFINRPNNNQGLFGRAQSATIKNLGLIGVNIAGANLVGGLAGGIEGPPVTTVINSYATGKVIGTNVVGGLVGRVFGGKVSNSYATGEVTGIGNIGGLVGMNNTLQEIENSYATGAVTGTSDVGGLVGWNGGTVTNSFYDSNTTGQSDDTGKGTPKTTAQMKDIATFSDAGWDIVDGWEQPNGNDWGICQNISYPFLLWQYDVSPCGALGDSAYRHCTTNNQRWYDDAMDANANRVLILPYSPGSASGWWAGYALINTHATRNIPQDALCLAAMDKDGRSFAKVHGRPLFTQNMFVGTVPDIDPDEPRWANQLVLGVFKHPDATVDALHGFTMMGDTVQAAGYFADNRGARTRLSFDYTPGSPWWRGFALYNNHPLQTAYVRVVAHQADGRPVELKDRDRIVLSPGRMLVEEIESILPDMDPDQRARVEFLAETSDGDELEALHGFVFFGDGRQAMGYLGQ